MAVAAATRLRQVPRARCDDNDSPIAASDDNPLQIGHRRSQRDLMDHHDLADRVEEAVLQFDDSRQLAIGVGAAETGIVQAINHYGSLCREAGAIGAHLW